MIPGDRRSPVRPGAPRIGFPHHRHFGFGIGYPWGYWSPYGPYGWWHWGYPGYGYGYYGGSYGYGAAPARYVAPASPGGINLQVTPKATQVYVDGQPVGEARQFNGFPGYLWLAPGTRELSFYRDGYVTEQRTVDVRSDWIIDLRLELRRGQTTPVPEIHEPVDDEHWRVR